MEDTLKIQIDNYSGPLDALLDLAKLQADTICSILASLGLAIKIGPLYFEFLALFKIVIRLSKLCPSIGPM